MRVANLIMWYYARIVISIISVGSLIVLASCMTKTTAGAIAQFTDPRSTIWASSYQKSFLDKKNLPTTSLCDLVGMETPKYDISNWASDLACVKHKDTDLGLQIIHTPGHTPDEIAVWDASERTLYVGDTLYEWVPIIFPKEANIKLFSSSIARLKELVKTWNSDTDLLLPKVKIACGHVTSCVDAAEILDEVDTFLYQVVKGWLEPSREEENRGELDQRFERKDKKLSLRAPKRLLDEFRADKEAMSAIEARQKQTEAART
jgi:glyoxylase-like metal-dependent hydrolase (beta-lactamase superfamily II)